MKRLILLMHLLVPTACALAAPGRYQEGVVRQKGEMPCFAVADTEETRTTAPRLAVVDVGERLTVGAKSIWELSWGEDGGQLPALSPEGCIVYGTAELGGKPRLVPVALFPGKRYEMNIWSYIGDKAKKESKARNYHGNFCLTTEPAHKPVVHQVFWDDRLNKWRWDVCGLENSAE